jgi:hypothetical protein
VKQYTFRATCAPLLGLSANLFLLLPATALLSGCGSSDSLDKACSVLAEAQCDRRQACTDTVLGSAGTVVYPDGVFILSTYGDKATCLARQHLACMNNASAAGSGNSVAQLEKCASEYSSWSCSDLFDGNANPPPDCVPPGSRANGQTCALAGQCASRFCAGTKNATCGVCADEPVDGASCETSGCAAGQTCKTESMEALVCRDRLPVDNSTCSADVPCQAFSSCVGASPIDATETGTCTATAVTLGASCGGNANPGCESNLGLACLGPAGGKTCQQVAYVPAASACATLADGSRAACIGSDCFTANGPAAATDTDATCVARAADGAACDTQHGRLCLTPARCVTSGGSTAGVCVVPSLCQ